MNPADIIIRNLRTKKVLIGKQVETGLVLSGLELLRQSQLKVPVEFGPLKGSGYTRKMGTGMDTVVAVGYTAAYALYVHELVGMKLKGLPRRPSPPHKGRYWDPQGQGQAKFLEEPFRAFKPTLIKIVKSQIII